MLERMRLASRLGLMAIVSVAGLVVLGAASLWTSHGQLVDSEMRRVNDVVTATDSVFKHFYGLQSSDAMSRDEAQQRALELLRNLRFEDGKNYVFVFDSHATALLSPMKPETEGKSMAGLTDPEGFPLFDRIAEVARSGKAAELDYVWPRTAGGEPERKHSSVKAFKPWGWAYGAGVYLTEVEEAFSAGLAMTSMVAFAVLLAMALVSLLVVRSVLRQLGGEPADAVAAMRELAQGNLRAAIDNKGGADSLLGTLATTLAQLRSMMTEVGRNAEALKASASALAGVARGVAERAQNQSDATSAIAAGVEEMTVSINHISDSARDTATNSSAAAALAEKGEEKTAEAADEMTRIAQTVGSASQRIQELVGRAREIGSIANVIKEIAAQTNLLALNAAIEAARAGEQGRGFAVVADEVRGLAERTAGATVQIEDMIKGIQKDTSGAVDAMSSVSAQVDSGVAQMHDAADSLREIRVGAGVALDRIRDVADATKEQSAASNAIAQQVEQIAQMVDGTSSAMLDAANSVDDLEVLSSSLNEVVGRFRY